MSWYYSDLAAKRHLATVHWLFSGILLARSLGGSFTNMARNARACVDTRKSLKACCNSKQIHHYSKVWQSWKVPTCPCSVCSMQLCQKHLNRVDVPVTLFDKCATAFPDLLWPSQETSREPMRTSVKKSTHIQHLCVLIPRSQINFSNFRFGTDHLELQGKDEKVEPSNVEEASFGDWVSGGHERNHFCEESMSHLWWDV